MPTMFNAISGVYEPTEGRIRFERQDLRRPLRRIQFLWWSLLGLSVGLALLLLSSNVDLLWSTAVKQNFVGRAQGFPLAKAWRDLRAHVAAGPRIDRRTGRFWVTTADGRTPFGVAK